MDNPRITFTSRADATPEAESNVLANVYRLVLDCHAKQMAAEPHSCNDVKVRNTEEVGHVEQRPVKPSEIVVTYSRKSRNQ
jgi:hypothetical protein